MTALDKARNIMLAVQRTSKEQGIAMQALLELCDPELILAAHDSIRKQAADGRLAFFPAGTSVTDSAAAGEAVFRAFEMTDDDRFKKAAESMLEYYMIHAPHTEDGIIYHSNNSVHADACYTLPPFLAVMGELIEAVKQLVGYMFFLRDDESGLLHNIYAAKDEKVALKKFGASGNGWALLGIARVIAEAEKQGAKDTYDMLCETGIALLDSMLNFQRGDGMFGDVLDDVDSPANLTCAMTAAAFIYQGAEGKWLSADYVKYADKIKRAIERKTDDYGIIEDVCGLCETHAAYIMMEVRRNKYIMSITN